MPNRVSLNDLQATLDPQTTFDWALWLPTVPGTSFTTKDFTFRCTTTNVPSQTHEDFLVETHGLQFQHPGRVIWDKKLDVTFFETRDGVARNLMLDWLKYIRDSFNNTGSYRDQFSVRAEMNLYDAPGNITKRIELWKFYPLSIGQATLDQSSQVLTYQCSFSFDRTLDIAV